MAIKHKAPTLHKRRAARASSLIETVCGSIIIIIVALFLVDVAAVVVCQTQNDALAKHCARAAANKDTLPLAQASVVEVTNEFKKTGGGSKICLFDSAVLDPAAYGNDTAYVQTTVTCNFPVPVPFGPAFLQFKADAMEPVVAKLPP
ncbi:MAG: hypothetical protein IPP57_26410 [Candidatus Obscuribacter sp.]|jgi:hypothetical protein|nr:hypothetical protein [Candidatus Obscuribacter sp.]MDQ5967106.1 hypothetical protein [Cyanobacteriota bacterium erpe_2018_sw_39hr_WHONDRS-SW48-000098_B_bin.30]MBK7836967.1 hypothetical protein [Candidatus Obscuribacter sp.]MBK9620445.1 hypothetical protein [Candidatus Obscuribacter sp.]MBK9774312.1 hypothetical protein [Candidatus Obscuribacter sp.]